MVAHGVSIALMLLPAHAGWWGIREGMVLLGESFSCKFDKATWHVLQEGWHLLREGMLGLEM